MTQEQFIKKIAKYVQKYAPRYDIKVCSPVIAQAILESASGTSELAVNAHNYFGLKYRAGRCPTANGIYYKIGSEQNADGSYTTSSMKWMKFKNMEQGVIGYFDFTNISTYESIKNVDDPEIYLKNIKSSGYATSLNYVKNLMSVIKKYNLTQYDTVVKKVSESRDNKGASSMTYKIAIDAGHGSNTAGKRTVSGYREHWANVKCANYFDIAMKRCGFQTVKIAWDDTNATDDIDVALSTRQKQIKNAKCHASFSWHANAHGNGSKYTDGQGIETLIHSNSSYVKNSKQLANKVQAQLIKGTTQKNRGVKTSSLAMCNCIAMGTNASILIEIGFMTNKHEEQLIQSDAFCMECAEEAARGACEYFGVTYIPAKNTSVSTTQEQKTTTNIPIQNNITDTVSLKATSTKKGVQEFLNKYYGNEIKKVLGTLLAVDGAIGNKSKTALGIAIQVELNKIGANLTVDGKIGAKSDAAFNKYIGVLRRGSKGIFVTLWQCILIGHGISLNGGIDGDFGSGTSMATNCLFAKIGLKKDSSVSGADINALL